MKKNKERDEDSYAVAVKVAPAKQRPLPKPSVEHEIPVRRVTPKKRRLNRKRKMLLVMLAVLVGGIAWGAHMISSPVTGREVAATDSLVQTVKKTKAPVGTPTNVDDNPYFKLDLPAGYKAQANSQPVPGLSYQKTIIKPGAFGSIVINIAVKPLPDGGLQGDSSYQLRTQSPARYKMSSRSIGASNVTIFNDAQAASVVAFWPNGGNLATISLNVGIDNPASDDNRDIIRALQPILAAWQWQ